MAPLKKGTSSAVIANNIKTATAAGTPRRQAIANAITKARESAPPKGKGKR